MPELNIPAAKKTTRKTRQSRTRTTPPKDRLQRTVPDSVALAVSHLTSLGYKVTISR